VKDHRFNWSYTWTKTFLQSKGLLEKARRRGAHRRKRPRRPLPGMLLHQDGSRHQWLAGQPMLDLIVPLAGIELRSDLRRLAALPRTFDCTMTYSVVRQRDSLLYVEVSLCDIADPAATAICMSRKRRYMARRQPEITPNTPLRLADAVKIAFPLGGVTVAGLRRERDRNRLVIEKIAGKEFTTLAHIERMRELCRDEARAQGSSLRPLAAARAERLPTRQRGSSETTDATSAQAALQMRLRPRRES
jgi:hypothetical protein